MSVKQTSDEILARAMIRNICQALAKTFARKLPHNIYDLIISEARAERNRVRERVLEDMLR